MQLNFFFASRGYKYSGLSLSEDASDMAACSDSLEKSYSIERGSREFYTKPLPWIISTVCLLLFNLALGLRLAALQRFGTYSTGFVTEFGRFKHHNPKLRENPVQTLTLR